MLCPTISTRTPILYPFCVKLEAPFMNTTQLARTRSQNFFLILLLGILSTVTPLSIDLYLPAFPEIARALNTTIARVTFSVSTYFIGYAFGQLLYGPLLDRFGRKPPLYAGLVLYVFASLGCMHSTSVDTLLLYRFVQAFGGCVAGVAATAMVKDFFAPEETVKIFSLLMLVLSVSPFLAPTLGTFIAAAWGWQAVFAVLAGMAILVLALIFFFLPDGHTGDRSHALHPKAIALGFLSILKNSRFSTYTLAGSFSFAGLFVYVAGSPGIFLNEFHVSTKAYSAIFAFLALGMIGSGQLNLWLTRRFSNEAVFASALWIQVFIGALFFFAVLNGTCGLIPTIAFLFAILSCAGITYPNAAALALAPFSKNAGSASALLGFLQLGLGSVVSSSIGLFNRTGTLPTSTVIFGSSAIGLLTLKVFQKKTI